MNGEFQICELFRSVCGEGQEIGEPAVFVRFNGCNRRCSYCDTTYSWPEGKKMALVELLTAVKNEGMGHTHTIFLTGGEPTIQFDLEKLLILLRAEEWRVILQTNGTNFLPRCFNLTDLLSVDIKGPSSGKCADQKVIDEIYDWCQSYPGPRDHRAQFKYVIGTEEDWSHMLGSVRRWPRMVHICQPMGEGQWEMSKYLDKLRWLAEKVSAEINFNQAERVKVLPQMHKLCWGLKRGV